MAVGHEYTVEEATPRYRELYREFAECVLGKPAPQGPILEWQTIEMWNEFAKHKHVRRAIRRIPVERREKCL